VVADIERFTLEKKCWDLSDVCELSLTLVGRVDVEQHISNKIHKPNTLEF
jgi:hypothetical protein